MIPATYVDIQLAWYMNINDKFMGLLLEGTIEIDPVYTKQSSVTNLSLHRL